MKLDAESLIMLLKLAQDNNCSAGALPLAIEWIEKADKSISELIEVLKPFAHVTRPESDHWPDSGLVTEDQHVFNCDKNTL